jgi:hypothetical protein
VVPDALPATQIGERFLATRLWLRSNAVYIESKQLVGYLFLAPNGLAREFHPCPMLRVDRKSWAPSRMTRLTRLESPESVATTTNVAPVLPLMTETDSELQGLLPQMSPPSALSTSLVSISSAEHRDGGRRAAALAPTNSIKDSNFYLPTIEKKRILFRVCPRLQHLVGHLWAMVRADANWRCRG